MRALKMALKPHEDRLFVEPAGWTLLYGAWQDRAKSTRELAERATNDHAKKLLLIIADVYDRLSK
jgi:hypothetical protein